jgi:hypothetical protein
MLRDLLATKRLTAVRPSPQELTRYTVIVCRWGSDCISDSAPRHALFFPDRYIPLSLPSTIVHYYPQTSLFRRCNQQQVQLFLSQKINEQGSARTLYIAWLPSKASVVGRGRPRQSNLISPKRRLCTYDRPMTFEGNDVGGRMSSRARSLPSLLRSKSDATTIDTNRPLDHLCGSWASFCMEEMYSRFFSAQIFFLSPTTSRSRPGRAGQREQPAPLAMAAAVHAALAAQGQQAWPWVAAPLPSAAYSGAPG